MPPPLQKVGSLFTAPKRCPFWATRFNDTVEREGGDDRRAQLFSPSSMQYPLDSKRESPIHRLKAYYDFLGFFLPSHIDLARGVRFFFHCVTSSSSSSSSSSRDLCLSSSTLLSKGRSKARGGLSSRGFLFGVPREFGCFGPLSLSAHEPNGGLVSPYQQNYSGAFEYCMYLARSYKMFFFTLI